MKHLIILLACFTVSPLFFFFVCGAKFGASFPSETDLLKLVRETDQLTKLENSVTGWQVGFYGKIELSSIYLRPELQYTTTRLKFEDFEYTKGNLEMPISVGFEFLSILSVFAGPSLQYQISDTIESVVFVKEIENKTTLGFHFGMRVQIGPIGVGLRYERAFSGKEIEVINNNVNLPFGSFDNRPKQLLIDLSYRF